MADIKTSDFRKNSKKSHSRLFRLFNADFFEKTSEKSEIRLEKDD